MAIKHLARYLLWMRSQYNEVNYKLYEHKHNNPPLKRKSPPKNWYTNGKGIFPNCNTEGFPLEI